MMMHVSSSGFGDIGAPHKVQSPHCNARRDCVSGVFTETYHHDLWRQEARLAFFATFLNQPSAARDTLFNVVAPRTAHSLSKFDPVLDLCQKILHL